MPLGYVSTYMNAEDAIDAADARVEYLNRIYEILKCDEQEKTASHQGYFVPNGYYPTTDNVYAEPKPASSEYRPEESKNYAMAQQQLQTY